MEKGGRKGEGGRKGGRKGEGRKGGREGAFSCTLVGYTCGVKASMTLE